MEDFVVTIKKSGEIEGLDEYLLSCPKSFIYSSPKFLSIINDTLNTTENWLVASNGSNILGLLPYFYFDGPFGRVYNSLAYFGSNGGVIQHENNKEIKKTLISRFFQVSNDNNACSATIITNPLEDDISIYENTLNFDYKTERIGQVTFLNKIGNDKPLIDSFDNPRPRNIRKAIKSGFKVKISHKLEDINFLYSIHKENMIDIGGRVKELKFFNLIYNNLSTDFWEILVAENSKGQKVSALLLLYYNETVEYFTPVTKKEFRVDQPLALLIYEGMKKAIENGYNNWNWGGTWLSQKGVFDFKKKWGTSNFKYFYYTKVFDKNLLYKKESELAQGYKGMYLVPYEFLKEKDDSKSFNLISDGISSKIVDRIIYYVSKYFSPIPFVNNERNNSLRKAIFKNLISKLLTDDERAKFYNFPEGCRIRESSKIISPENLQIGKYCWIGENSILDASGGLQIGEHTSIGLSVFIWSHSSHIANLNEDNVIKSKYLNRRKTSIGSGCFISGPSVIASGVRIGNKVLIQPFSYVNKDIPDRSVVSANKVKIGILSDKMIEKLKET